LSLLSFLVSLCLPYLSVIYFFPIYKYSSFFQLFFKLYSSIILKLEMCTVSVYLNAHWMYILPFFMMMTNHLVGRNFRISSTCHTQCSKSMRNNPKKRGEKNRRKKENNVLPFGVASPRSPLSLSLTITPPTAIFYTNSSNL